MFIPPYPYIPKYASAETVRKFNRDLRIVKWVFIGMIIGFLLIITTIVLTK